MRTCNQPASITIVPVDVPPGGLVWTIDTAFQPGDVNTGTFVGGTGWHASGAAGYNFNWAWSLSNELMQRTTRVYATLANSSTSDYLVTVSGKFSATLYVSGGTTLGNGGMKIDLTNSLAQTAGGWAYASGTAGATIWKGTNTVSLIVPAGGTLTIGVSLQLSLNFHETTTQIISGSFIVSPAVLPTSTTTVTASNLNPTSLDNVTLTATVALSSGTATGFATFYDGTTIIGYGAVSAGVGTFVYKLPAGVHSVTAEFSGNAQASTSPAITVTSTAAGNLLTNPGFESSGSSFAGWTPSAFGAGTSVTNAAPFVHSGVRGARMGPWPSMLYLAQTLTTGAGKTYQITFWLYSGVAGTSSMQVLWEGSVVETTTNAGNTGWVLHTVNVTATGATSEAKFGFANQPDFFGFDDVSVIQTG